MKYFIFILVVGFFVLTNISCKKSKGIDISVLAGPIIVKYEITTNTTFRAQSGSLTLTYVNSTGQNQTEIRTFITDTNPWNKTVTITTPTRPLKLSLLPTTLSSYYLVLESRSSVAQSVTLNIYVNDKLVASSTNTGGSNIKINALEYTIN
jgi:hypothetical protein